MRLETVVVMRLETVVVFAQLKEKEHATKRLHTSSSPSCSFLPNFGGTHTSISPDITSTGIPLIFCLIVSVGF